MGEDSYVSKCNSNEGSSNPRKFPQRDGATPLQMQAIELDGTQSQSEVRLLPRQNPPQA